MTYKIGTSHQCRKCGGPIIAQEADREVERLRTGLQELQRAQYRNGTHGDPPMVSVDSEVWHDVFRRLLP